MSKFRSVKLGDLLTESKIISQEPNSDKRITVKLNLGGVEKRPNKEDVTGATKYYIRSKGQFIYGKQNLFKGAFGVVPDELDGYESSSDIPAFDVCNECVPEWIVRYLQYNENYKKLENIAKGSGSKRIHAEQIFEVSIPLPDIKIQKGLLKKFRESEIILDKISSISGNQEEYISKLRKSILQEAMQGTLVSQDSNDESATVLLKKIKEEKERLVKEGKIKKEKPLSPITEDEIPYELPNGWEWMRFSTILQDLRYGTSQKCDYDINGTPVLRIPNIIKEKIDFSDLKFTVLTSKEKEDLEVKKDDLLMIRSNGSTSIVGKVALIEEYAEGYAYAGYLIRLRILKQYIVSKYIILALKSPFIRYQIENPIRTTTGVKNINTTEISKLIFPLPPLNEQTRIVQKVDILMSLCDELEKNIKQSKNDSELLMQSVLQEAFSDKSGEDIEISFGEFIKQKRKDKGITVTDMLKLLKDVKSSEYTKIEEGLVKPEKLIIEKIAKVLKLSEIEMKLFDKLKVITNMDEYSDSDYELKIAARRVNRN